jgi:hypothetical protein
LNGVETFTALGALGTVGMGFAGVVRWVFALSEKASRALDGVAEIRAEREIDKAVYDRRLEKAEDAAASIRSLADAVKHQGELTALEIRNLTERLAEHSSFTKEAMGELKHGQKNQETAIQALKQQIAKLN